MPSPLSDWSLSRRFAVASAMVLIAGAFLLGTWITEEIETSVLRRAAADSALYVEALLEPHLAALATGRLTETQRVDLGRTIARAMDRRVAAVKVWRPDGEIVYASRGELVGVKSGSDELARAVAGTVISGVSDLRKDENIYERELASSLIETYIPLRGATDHVVAVAEFYQYTDLLDAELRTARLSTWAIIAGATIAMYVLLAGMVRAGSSTIDHQRRELEATVRRLSDTTKRLQQVSAARAETDEAALRRVASELHDGIAQDLAAALFQLKRQPGALELERARAALDSALGEVRTLARGLALPDLAPLPIAAVIEQACLDHERKTGHDVEREIGSLPAHVAIEMKICVYRVLEEALSNAYRHAHEAPVAVRAWADEGVLHLTCADTGPGLPVAPSEGLGLRGMRERAALLGGSFTIGPRAEGGTLVSIELPLT